MILPDATTFYIRLFLLEFCSFQAVSSSECPCSDADDYYNDDYYEYYDYSGCRIDVSCSHGLNHNDLCEADGPLPDGNQNFDINNCPGKYDVFRCLKGKQTTQGLKINEQNESNWLMYIYKDLQ